MLGPTMRAVFMGTPEVAVPSLDALADHHEVVGVVCQPDRPAGRGLTLQLPPVKRRALERGLDVVQPAKVRTGEFAAWLRSLRADFALVLAYGRILPKDVLEAPARGCLNLHASLLPRLRGAAPIQWAILRGDRETGVSLMQMAEGLDTGPVFASRAIAIDPDETAGELSLRVAALAAEVTRLELPRVLDGTLASRAQLEADATLAPLLRKDDGRIDWNRRAVEIHDHVRGMNPWPGAFTQVGGRRLKVLRTRRTEFAKPGAVPGVVVLADPRSVLVACSDGALEILEAQLEGKKAVAGRDLVNARVLTSGARLGE